MTTNNDGRLKDLMDLSHVPRWTTHPVTRPQSVAEHTFRVMVIARELVGRIGGDEQDTLNVLEWAMDHDAPESKTGDMPRPFKQLVGSDAVYRLEREACPWYNRPIHGGLSAHIVAMADAIESLSWISTYGNGLKDKFTYEGLEAQCRNRVYKMAEELGNEWMDAAMSILAVVAP